MNLEDAKLHRGNKLWNANFILPEQKLALAEYHHEKMKVERPILDEQEFQEIGYVVMESLNYELPVNIEYWDDGYYKNIVCTVDKVDEELKRIKIKVDEEYNFIDIDCLKSVERI